MTLLSDAELAELAPDGELYVAIAVGPAASAVWCVRDADDGEPRGVTVSIAKEIGKRWDLPVNLVEFASSGDIVAKSDTSLWTISFVPIDNERRNALAVGPNYYLGISTYLTRTAEFGTVEDVDVSGVRVVGVAGTATFRSAERSLKDTRIVPMESLDEAVVKFREGDVDAVALGKESILSLLGGMPDCHAVGGHFHEAGTAVVVPSANLHALAAATRIIHEIKLDGTMRSIFDQNQMGHAAVAP
jgi:polar amino acid transport system substrate-binding protein